MTGSEHLELPGCGHTHIKMSFHFLWKYLKDKRSQSCGYFSFTLVITCCISVSLLCVCPHERMLACYQGGLHERLFNTVLCRENWRDAETVWAQHQQREREERKQEQKKAGQQKTSNTRPRSDQRKMVWLQRRFWLHVQPFEARIVLIEMRLWESVMDLEEAWG